MIYFDNAATTYPKPNCVYDAINDAMKNFSFNAGRGSYKAAQETFKMIDTTREMIGSLVGSSKNNVIFTSSATESLNNIIYGLELKNQIVYVSPFEHNAIIRTLNNTGAIVKIIPFDERSWDLEKDDFEAMLATAKPKAIIISHISNVTGYLLPYEEIFKLGKKYGSTNVLDSAQGFGVYPINPSGIDFVVFAGHKSLYAMFGIAGYICLNGGNLTIYKVGGTGSDSLNPSMPDVLPGKLEAGSMNSVGIYSIYSALGFLKNSNFGKIKKELSNYFINEVKKIKNVKVYLPENCVSHGIVSINVDGYKPDDVGMILSEDYDICVRTGYHCAPYVHEFIGSKNCNGTVRVSFSGFNTKTEVDILINALKQL